LNEVSEALWDKVIAVNVKGPFRLTAAIGSRMAADSGGSILNVSSIAAIRPNAHQLPYAAAKAGLNTLTEGFARAFRPHRAGQRDTAGPFLTDISKAWDLEAFAERARTTIALGRGENPTKLSVRAVLRVRGLVLLHRSRVASRRRRR